MARWQGTLQVSANINNISSNRLHISWQMNIFVPQKILKAYKIILMVNWQSNEDVVQWLFSNIFMWWKQGLYFSFVIFALYPLLYLSFLSNWLLLYFNRSDVMDGSNSISKTMGLKNNKNQHFTCKNWQHKYIFGKGYLKNEDHRPYWSWVIMWKAFTAWILFDFTVF